MEIKNPRRILILGPPNSDFARVAKELTGSAPQPDTTGSFAGAIHEWNVKTAYYSANIPIWVDEVVDIQQWKSDFLNPEAKEVVEAVGAWIYCTPPPSGITGRSEGQEIRDLEDAMKAMDEVITTACGDDWDGALLILDMSPEAAQTHIEAAEDQCLEYSFEYIHAAAKGKNEYGEAQGLDRMREALEANDWKAQITEDDSEHEATSGDLDTEKALMNSELWAMKASLLDSDGDAEDSHKDDAGLQVDSLESMMSQILHIKESAADMPEAKRKAYAARAIDDLMKDF